jgi:predicted glycosyltransferase
VPKAFPDNALKKFGASPEKIHKYNGFKEQIYLSDFKPDPSFSKDVVRACDLGADWDYEKKVLVAVRGPATLAAYHHFKNPLFFKVLERLNSNSQCTVIAMPRNAQQAEAIRNNFPKVKIPHEILSGTDLVCFSDVVISAGGTMNREAAILGTPAFTMFAGELPAVDRQLQNIGRLQVISQETDLDKISFRKKSSTTILANKSLCEEFIREITGH